MDYDVNSLFKSLSLGQGLGSTFGGLAGLFGGNKSKSNPSYFANQYLNQVPGAINPYFQPYINAGQGVAPGLQKTYEGLTENPGEFYNKISAGYKESPGYQFKLQQALNSANNAAAAGGTIGTPQHQQISADVTNGIASQDFENYLSHALGLFGGGLSGQEGIVNRGYQAGTRYGEDIGDLLGRQGQYAYAGQAGLNQENAKNKADIFSGLGSLLPFLFGGFSFGGSK